MTHAHPIDRDEQIRALLLPRLRERARWVCEEFPCDGRVDVATIEGDRLCGYEIKAARDTLKRLFGLDPRFPEFSQIKMYSTLFDRLTVVCAPNHRDELLARLPTWWGVTVVEGEVFRVVRAAEQNPADTMERLGWTMWLGEARALLLANGGTRGARDRGAIANRMKELPAAVVREGALSAMMRRPWGGPRKRKPTHHEATP